MNQIKRQEGHAKDAQRTTRAAGDANAAGCARVPGSIRFIAMANKGSCTNHVTHVTGGGGSAESHTLILNIHGMLSRSRRKGKAKVAYFGARGN